MENITKEEIKTCLREYANHFHTLNQFNLVSIAIGKWGVLTKDAWEAIMELCIEGVVGV